MRFLTGRKPYPEMAGSDRVLRSDIAGGGGAMSARLMWARHRVTCPGCGEATTTHWADWCRSACWLVCAVCGVVSRVTPVLLEGMT
jgi:hypothetical protein